MTAEERAEWLKAARMTLSGIPADLLARGCAKARETCRFPSEIVPAILEEIRLAWQWRQEEARQLEERAELLKAALPKQEWEADPVKPEQLRALVRSIGRA